LGTKISAIIEGIIVEEELVSSDFAANEVELPETTSSSLEIINQIII